jgi:uncharacterized membrane-anchored protein
MKCVPKINQLYWASLILASIFGANAGDYLADGLGLGHLSGIPYLAACLIVVFMIERFARRPSALYFWVAIIIIRASATNIGDVFHDYKIGFTYSVPLTALLLIVSVAIWRMVRPPTSIPGIVPVNGFYWVSMFLAGVLGTVGGDAMSYGVHLGNLYATIVLAIPLALVFVIGRHGLLTQLYYYWLTVSLIRSAGTAAGDWIAHGYLGLAGATAASGTVFLFAILLNYAVSSENIRLVRQEILDSAKSRPVRP